MRASVVILVLPLLGFVVLLAEPGADPHWQHRPTHFPSERTRW